MDEVSSLYMLSACQGQGMLKGKQFFMLREFFFLTQEKINILKNSKGKLKL